MATVLKTTIRLKRGTAQRWLEVNPILADGEPGYEYDTNKIKIGNGVSTWKELPYMTSEINDSEILVVNNKDELPEVGEYGKLYQVLSSNMLYQWSNTKYTPIGGEGSFDPSTITLINGGKANG